MQGVTENCHHSEQFGEPLTQEVNFSLPLEQGILLILLGERMFLVAVDKFRVVRKIIRFLSNKQSIVSIPLLKYRYFGSFPSDHVPTLDTDTFATNNTQPSNMQSEDRIMIAYFCHGMFYRSLKQH